jgi:hypothetical protein
MMAMTAGRGHTGQTIIGRDGTSLCCTSSGDPAQKQPASWAPLAYHPIDPVRVLDSRPTGRPGPGETLRIALSDIPAGAGALLCNLTVTDPRGAGFFTVFRGDLADANRPLVCSVRYTEDDGSQVALVKVPLVAGSTTHTLKVFQGKTAGTAHIIVDIVGYDAPA